MNNAYNTLIGRLYLKN